ncbi:glutamate receptor ionotropic, delta-1-like [Galendromus occidentalis]|uniref:Glutamate receptor ionotropic, delta-1-like n=1 Tax=Galendromus occidentalis TaxID=34638 RepID=A0AAJ7L3K9_9ACAR|nr:glutamate receptor ionotropic, delta-1-like [Galendromus occidentalis]
MACRDCPIVLPKILDCNESLDDGILRLAGLSPYIRMEDLGNGSMRLDGPMVIFIEAIARFMKAKPVIVNGVGSVYGGKGEDGMYDGVLGLLQRGRAEMLCAPSIPTPDRVIDFDYNAHFTSQGIRLLTRKPDSYVDPWGFVKVFKPAVWCYLALTLVLLSACTAILHWMDSLVSFHEADKKRRGFAGYIWFWYARFFPMPEVSPPRQWLRWCAVSFMLPTSLFLVSSLEADLKSSLVFKTEQDYVNSYEDLLRFKNVKIFAEKGNLLYAMFTRSDHPVLKKLAPRLEARDGFLSLSPGFEKILDEIIDGEGVLVASDEMAMGAIVKLMRQTGTCPRIQISHGAAMHLSGYLALAKHMSWEIREKIQHVRLWIGESYIFHQNIKWRLEPYYRCSSKTLDVTLEPLAAENLEGVGYFYAIGIAVSTLGFVYETIEARRNRYSRRIIFRA